MRRLGAEGREGRRRVQARGEIANKRFHRGMPEPVEAEEIHLFHRLFSGPLLKGHAVGGGENAGAIVAEAAVHEDFVAWIVAEESEKLDKLFVGGRRPATDGDVNEAHTQRLGVLAFPCDFFAVFAAEVYDGGDAEDFQFREADVPGLRAAIEDLGNFSSVGNTVNMQFLPKGGLNEGWSRTLGNRLRRSLRKKGKRKSEKEGERWENSFHVERGTSSVA